MCVGSVPMRYVDIKRNVWGRGSNELISYITNTVHEDVSAWRNRPLEELYLAPGIDIDGRKELLGMWIAHY